MCVCMCVCVCVYIYIHIHTHIHTPVKGKEIPGQAVRVPGGSG